MTVDEVLYACELAVLRALELAGKRCRTITRGERFALIDNDHTPLYELHTRVTLAGRNSYLNQSSAETTIAEYDRLLDGAWDHLGLVLPNSWPLVVACDMYTRELIRQQAPHQTAELRKYLDTACEHAAAT